MRQTDRQHLVENFGQINTIDNGSKFNLEKLFQAYKREVKIVDRLASENTRVKTTNFTLWFCLLLSVLSGLLLAFRVGG